MDHFHVVEFIDGCLNDYDSGAIEDLAGARAYLAEVANADDFRYWKPEGSDRYEQINGPYILTIEACAAAACWERTR